MVARCHPVALPLATSPDHARGLRVQTRTLLNRLKRAEDVAEARSIVSPRCICFPKLEPPFVGFPIELEIAARVKCPLHGDRFRMPSTFIYVSRWLRAKLWKHLESHHS